MNSYRNFILGSVSKICENSTIYSFIIEEVVTNIKFLIFVLPIIVASIVILILMYFIGNGRLQKYLIYPVGIYIFIIAIMFKVSKSSNGSLIIDIDQYLYNALKGIDESKSSIFPGIILFVLGGMNKNGNVSNCEIDRINSSNQLRPSGHDLFSFLNGSIEPNNPLIFNQKRKATITISNNKIEDPIKKLIDITDIKEIKDQNRINPKGKTDNPKFIEKKPIWSDISHSQDNQLKDFDTKSKNYHSPIKTAIQESLSYKPNTSAGKSSTSSIKTTENELKEISPKLTVNLEEESKYGSYPLNFKHIHEMLNEEFSTNNKASSNIKEMNKIIDNVETETQKLEISFKKFFVITNKIEKELRSFNASTKGIEDLWGSIVSNLKKFLSLKTIFLNLNFKKSNDTDLNHVFKIDSNKETYKGNNTDDSSILVQILQVSLIIQAILATLFLYMILSGRRTFLIKFISSIFLVGNCFLGVLFMVQAHFLDRDCTLGRIPNCTSKFSKDFIEFARSADLEIKSFETDKVDKLQKSLDKIEKRTQNITTVLKDFFRDDPVKEFHIHKIVVKNVFDKINFVKDDFDELTHSKINKSELFSLMDKIDISLAQIEQDLGFIDRSFLLEFFLKEQTFEKFLKDEKNKLILETIKQLDASSVKNEKEKRNACEEKRLAVCKRVKDMDLISLLLMFGSLLLLISFLLL